MLVSNWMTKDVITVNDDSPMMDASQLMKEKKVQVLPVLGKRGKLVGIVSDRDLKAASPSKATTLDVHEMYYLLSKIKIKEVMTKDPVTIGVDSTVEKAAVIMLEKKISGLPVLDDSNNLVGILTQGDVFRVLTNITGVYTGGVQFAFELEDRGGSIKEVADVLRDNGGRITSILTSYANAPEGKRYVFFRAQDIASDKLDAVIAELKAGFTFLYCVQDDEKVC